MKIAISVIIFTYGVSYATGMYVGSENELKSVPQFVGRNAPQTPQVIQSEPPPGDIEISTNLVAEQRKNQTATFNKIVSSDFVQKILSTIRRKQPIPVAPEPGKQLFGGRLPPFIERIVQRIQNYFSIYNPPEYFEGNRPPPSQSGGITIVCSNSENESLACGQMGSESAEDEDVELCEAAVIENPEQSSIAVAAAAAPQEEYNVVLTHTIVQDSQLNVYSPADTTHTVSNVVIILEPTAAEYSPPPVPTTPRNKFYVYVNPTSANKNKVESREKFEDYRPLTNNSTYTVVIRGDQLHEYSGNIDNPESNLLSPEIALLLQNSSADCGEARGECDDRSKTSIEQIAEEVVKADNKVPNINLILVPPEEDKSKRNRSCGQNKVSSTTNNPNLEYYVLKPESPQQQQQTANKSKNSYYLQKTQLDSVSATYLPPRQLDDEIFSTTEETTELLTTPPPSLETDRNKLSLLFNLFRKEANEPRQF